MMSPKIQATAKSEAIRSHLSITQSVIDRMATNSASCKAWCITIVSAILVLVADKGVPDYAMIALIPTILFLVLDSYYLCLERMFRKSYNGFITKLHQDEVVANDLFVMNPSGKRIKEFFRALISFSVWPFYTTLIALICVVKNIVL